MHVFNNLVYDVVLTFDGHKQMKRQPLFLIFSNTLYSLAMLISALLITWGILSAADFFYPTFYQWLDIGQTIHEFGPQNRYKDGFETTVMIQHVDYFSQIVTAINHGGAGLTQISYPHLGQQIPLLRDAEVRHLQDVANLMTKLFSVGGIVFTLLVAVIAFKIKKGRTFSRVRAQITQLIGFVVVVVTICWLIGFKTVFYWFHEVAFPSENDWFFYYQDSLMTTMMKAPMLFAPISGAMVILCCIVFVVLNWLVSLINSRINESLLPNG